MKTSKTIIISFLINAAIVLLLGLWLNSIGAYKGNDPVFSVGGTYIEAVSCVLVYVCFAVAKDQKDMTKNDFQTACIVALLPVLMAVISESVWGYGILSGSELGILVWIADMGAVLVYHVRHCKDQFTSGQTVARIFGLLALAAIGTAMNYFQRESWVTSWISMLLIPCYYLFIMKKKNLKFADQKEEAEE